MHKALCALTCAFALVDASQKFPQFKHLRRDGLSYTNATSNSTNSSTGQVTSVPSTAPTTTDSSSSSLTTTHVVAPISLANNTSYQNTSTPITTTSDVSCLGSVTYMNSVPPTVYATITESFLVTVSASNASLPPPVLSTPPVACAATVIPLAATNTDALPNIETAASSVDPACPFGMCLPGSASASSSAISFQPALTVITLSSAAEASSASRSNNVPNVATTNGPESSQVPEASTGSAFTSTVFVTKKTPVPVVIPPTSAPPVFQIPSTTKSPAVSPTSTGAGVSPPPGPSTPNGGTPKASTSKPPAASEPPTTTQLGSIIASIMNNPFAPISSGASITPAQSPGIAPAAPVTATIDSVPVQILPSSVVIGGQVLSIPGTSSETTLQVNGQIFTLQNSQIVAPGTTYAITTVRDQESSATALPSPVTAGGLTFSVGASQAIISGTTYAIGNGAGSSTTVRVGGKTVVIGSIGVLLASTTVAPLKSTPAPLAPEVITAAGLTFTIGQSFAVISGSTYTIGPDAKSTSIVVNGKTISVGSHGLGLATTTIAPEPNFSVITIGGLTFSVDSTEAILKGTTYQIGKGAPSKTTVVSGKTISLGPSGVGLPSTTIPPETGAVPTSTGVVQGAVTSLSARNWSALFALLVSLRAVFV